MNLNTDNINTIEVVDEYGRKFTHLYLTINSYTIEDGVLTFQVKHAPSYELFFEVVGE